jgi:hypothetical protein
MPRTGRPRKYEHPVRLVVWLEARELRRLHVVAKAAGAAPTSAWARRVLVEAAALDDASTIPARGERGGLAPRAHRAAGHRRGRG